MENDDGADPSSDVTKGKTYNTRGGQGRDCICDPRWLEAVALSDGTTFDLVENWDQLKLPPIVSGATRSTTPCPTGSS